MPGIKLFGDWNKIPEVVTLAARFQKSVQQAILKEGEYLRKQVVQGITSGAPGGKPFAPLSPATLAVRAMRGFGGSKPLIYTGTLRASIVVKRVGDAVFVGLLRSGAAKSGSANIGEIHEFGRSWTQAMSRKQYRFLFAALRKAGLSHNQVGPRLKSVAFKSQSGSVTITIPARPFIGPVFEQEKDKIAKRFWENVAKGVGGDLGMPR